MIPTAVKAFVVIVIVLAGTAWIAVATGHQSPRPTALQIALAQRDAAIQQRNAWRDKANAMIRVCRQHGMTGEDPAEWLTEVLPDGSERWQWNEAMKRARGAREE